MAPYSITIQGALCKRPPIHLGLLRWSALQEGFLEQEGFPSQVRNIRVPRSDHVPRLEGIFRKTDYTGPLRT